MIDAEDALRVLRSRSLPNVVQAEIERRILTGVLAPGARLNENALAAELGVSRGPIREACRGAGRDRAADRHRQSRFLRARGHPQGCDRRL